MELLFSAVKPLSLLSQSHLLLAVAPSLKLALGYPGLVHSEGPWGGGAEEGVADFGVVPTAAPVVLDGWNLTCLGDPQQQGERCGGISVVQAGCL